MDAVWRVLDEAGDVLPAVVVVFKAVPRYQQLDFPRRPHAPPHKLVNLELCEIMLRGLYELGGAGELFASKPLNSGPVHGDRLNGGRVPQQPHVQNTRDTLEDRRHLQWPLSPQARLTCAAGVDGRLRHGHHHEVAHLEAVGPLAVGFHGSLDALSLHFTVLELLVYHVEESATCFFFLTLLPLRVFLLCVVFFLVFFLRGLTRLFVFAERLLNLLATELASFCFSVTAEAEVSKTSPAGSEDFFFFLHVFFFNVILIFLTDIFVTAVTTV